jgi:3-hydroxyisobutyrate dehydrogenase
MTTPVVALLGTGTMGSAMARSMRRAGLSVRAWNRTRTKAEPLVDAGVVVADSPADAVQGADIVLTMLFDIDGVVDAIRQAAPAPGALWLQASTVGIGDVQTAVEVAEELGLVMVDSPVLGTRQPAEKGDLVVLASGPDDAREQAAFVFDAIGSRTLWLGGVGQGTRLKMVANAWVLSLTTAIAQSVAMAEGLGLDPQSFLAAIAGGATDTPYAQVKGPAMVKQEYPIAFSLAAALKDAGLILEALDKARVPDVLGAAVHRILSTAAERVDPTAVDLAAAVEALRPQRG